MSLSHRKPWRVRITFAGKQQVISFGTRESALKRAREESALGATVRLWNVDDESERYK